MSRSRDDGLLGRSSLQRWGFLCAGNWARRLIAEALLNVMGKGRFRALVEAWRDRLLWGEVPPSVLAQIGGAFIGVAAAALMFEEPLFAASQHVRAGWSQGGSEFVATFGLVAVSVGCTQSRPFVTPFAVAAYITAAYWFTASTSFANPAVTLARAATDTFAGIRPAQVPGFIAAQLLGAAGARGALGWLYCPVSPAGVGRTWTRCRLGASVRGEERITERRIQRC